MKVEAVLSQEDKGAQTGVGFRGVARILKGGVTLCQTLSSWRFRHGIL